MLKGALFILEFIVGGSVSKRKLGLVGKEFETNNCGKCVVLDYKGAYDVTVKFYNPEYIKKCTISSLKRGTVLNPYSPSVLGKGFFGEGEYTSEDMQYPLWKGVLRRCYDSESKYVSSSYKEAKEIYVQTVAEEYKSVMSGVVYKALLEYKVDVDD